MGHKRFQETAKAAIGEPRHIPRPSPRLFPVCRHPGTAQGRRKSPTLDEGRNEENVLKREENTNNSGNGSVCVKMLPFYFRQALNTCLLDSPLFRKITTSANETVQERNCVSAAWIIMSQVPHHQVCL